MSNLSHHCDTWPHHKRGRRPLPSTIPHPANTDDYAVFECQIGGHGQEGGYGGRVEEARGLVVRIAHLCQGILRVGDDVAVERWECKTDGAWERSFRIGHAELPGVTIFDGLASKSLAIGTTTVVKSRPWTLIEAGHT